MTDRVQQIRYGQLWRHKSGRQYVVLTVANEFSANENFPPMVMYMAAGAGYRQPIYACGIDHWRKTYVFIREKEFLVYAMRPLPPDKDEIYETKSGKTIAIFSDSIECFRVYNLLMSDAAFNPAHWGLRD